MSTLAWVSAAPFATPVVPPVYCSSASVVQRIDRRRRHVAVIVGQVLERDEVDVVGRLRQLLGQGEGREQPLGEGQRLGQRADDDAAERRALELRAQLGDQALQPHGHHDGDAGIEDLVLDLAVGIERVEIHHHAAGLQDPEIGDHEIGAIGQEQADPVARLDALVDQPAREAVGQLLDVGEAPAPVEEVDAGLVAMAGSRVIQQAVERARLELGPPVDPRRIGLQPGPRRCRFRRNEGHLAFLRSWGSSQRRYRRILLGNRQMFG